MQDLTRPRRQGLSGVDGKFEFASLHCDPGDDEHFPGAGHVLPEQKTLPAAGKQLPTAFTTEFIRVEMFGQEASQESVLRLMASFSGEEAA